MNTLNPDDLIAKIDNALETMCFVMADVVDAEDAAEEPSITTWIRFHNESEEGCLQLRASLGFVQEVGSGLLGIDPDEVEEGEQSQGVLLELANVIAGEVVCLLGGEETYFQLGLPSSEKVELNAPEEHIDITFDSMGETFCVGVVRGGKASENEAA